VNSVKTSKMGLWMSVVAMTLSASAAVATDETQTSQALIGDFTPDRPDVGTVGFPSPPPGAGPFTPPVAVNPDLPGTDEPPAVLTVEVFLQNLGQRLYNELTHQYLVTLEIHEGIAMEVAASNTPASRETIAAARAHYKAIAKSTQAEMRAIVIEATAQVRAMGASKDQMKALSNGAKEFRYISKLIAKSLHDETGDLGSGS
jgi:hypothetical protein